MTKYYILAVMDKDGILPELLEWFDSVVSAITEQARVKDRESYVLRIITHRKPEVENKK
jgi:hypothetical protein